MSRTHRAFTLVELLVVIAIIVILLSLLVPGLERALKAAEKSKCGAHLRGIALSCAGYALEYDRAFPTPTTYTNVGANNSLTIRIPVGNSSTMLTDKENYDNAVGIGHIIVDGRMGGITKGGEAVVCPTLDTSSGLPAKAGMDEAGITFEDNPNGSNALSNNTNNDHADGPSYWTDPARNNEKIMCSYPYRAVSYANTHSGGTIRTNIAKSSFVVVSDTISMSSIANNNRWGRLYHHLKGWMVGFGDGHASFVEDPARRDVTKAPGQPDEYGGGDSIKVVDPASGKTNGYLEESVVGNNAQYPGPAGPTGTGPNSNDTPSVSINGVTHPGTDEAVYKFLGGK